MLTRNRRKWLPQAIQCFQQQTYPNRELLILADGESVRDLVPAGDSIRLLELEGAPGIGDKRNLGCGRARGEVIAHWDDDDFSASGRLVDQCARLCESGKSVTGYHSMRFTDGTRWWRYEGTTDYIIGTSLCYRKEAWQRNKFPALQVGEDNQFVAVARARGEIVTADAGELMYATIHAGNTSPRTLGDNWKKL